MPCLQKNTRTFYCTEGSREAITITENVGLVVKNFVQQNSPVNNEMIRNSVMNDLYSADINGQMKMLPTVVREKHGKSEQVISYVSFCYDDDVDLEILNNKGRFNITAYDRRVYNAVSTLFLNERQTVSMAEIFGVMTGYVRTNPTQSQLDTIEKSLEKLRRIRVYIDLTEEVSHKMIQDKQPLIDAGILKNHSDKIKKAGEKHGVKKARYSRVFRLSESRHCLPTTELKKHLSRYLWSISDWKGRTPRTRRLHFRTIS